MKNISLIALALIAFSEITYSAVISDHQITKNSGFTTDLFHRIAEKHTTENTIISPVSIQTCLAMAFFGADGGTAEEMVTGLHFSTSDKRKIAESFENLLESARSSSMVNIANKLFANNGYTIKPEFNEVARKAFHSEAETLDFSKSDESVKHINDWVKSKTNNKIQDLLSHDSVDGDTSMILVNAIYFKGEWEQPFSTSSTHKVDFWATENSKQVADMMSTHKHFKYGEFADMDATAVEMPYKDSDFSMMIILPNQRTGIASLISKMENVDFLSLSERMKMEDVDVFLPKFKVEFGIKLNEVLKSMGMRVMFSDQANFSNLFSDSVPVKVSDVVHKAYIEVNEAGSEAAAATFIELENLSLNLNMKRFYADHPFIFLIKDKTSIYFIGNVAKF